MFSKFLSNDPRLGAPNNTLAYYGKRITEERKAFEAWLRKEFSWLLVDEELEGRMWKAWQARARLEGEE